MDNNGQMREKIVYVLLDPASQFNGVICGVFVINVIAVYKCLGVSSRCFCRERTGIIFDQITTQVIHRNPESGYSV